MENHYNCIYMYTNKINGKGYVGKTKDFLIRNRKHIYSSYNKRADDYNVAFHRAIRKYGIESFDVTILKENLTEDEMNYWEDYYIETFDLYAKNGKGYNLAKGGTGGNLIEGKTEEERKEIRQKRSNTWNNKTEEEMDELRQKQSELKKGKNHPMYGVHRYGKDAPMYGKHHTEETKRKMSENHADFSGKNHPKAKKVAQYDKQGNLIKIWDYAKQVEEELGIHNSSIIKCCKGKYKSAGGFIWKYDEEE